MVIIGGIAIAAFFVAYIISGGASDDGLRPEQIMLTQKRTDPVYRVITDASAVQKVAMTGGASAAPMTGEEVFKKTCHTCHVPGVLGAPKISDTAEWKKRLASQGIETLHKRAINGFKAMPPKGGNAALSDKEVMAAVDYILAQAGAK